MRESANNILTLSIKILASALFVVIALSIIAVESTKKPQAEIDAILKEQRESIRAILAGKDISKETKESAEVLHWPPKMNQPYPDLELIDRKGRLFKLSDMKGYILVMSYVDMSSPISQAQAGATASGAFGTITDVDKYAKPFPQLVEKNVTNNFLLPNDRVLEIYVLMYAQDGSQPKVTDAEEWAKHFNLNLERGVIVAVPKGDMRSNHAQSLITGYQLVDQNMMLRVDSAGTEAKHNLKMTLVPMLSKLAQ